MTRDGAWVGLNVWMTIEINRYDPRIQMDHSSRPNDLIGDVHHFLSPSCFVGDKPFGMAFHKRIPITKMIEFATAPPIPNRFPVPFLGTLLRLNL
jgi:hypothetical protein